MFISQTFLSSKCSSPGWFIKKWKNCDQKIIEINEKVLENRTYFSIIALRSFSIFF